MNENKQPNEEMNGGEEESFAFVGKEPRKVKLSNAVCAVIIAVVFAILLTFSVCTILDIVDTLKPDYNGGNNQGNNSTGNVEGGNAEIPSYFDNLITLDKIFKQYSFDGFAPS